MREVNEAPEKIYLRPLSDGETYNHWYRTDWENNCIEYTCTDAFIEKACEWLENHNDYQRVLDGGRGVRFDMTQCIIDFRKAMKGE